MAIDPTRHLNKIAFFYVEISSIGMQLPHSEIRKHRIYSVNSAILKSPETSIKSHFLCDYSTVVTNFAYSDFNCSEVVRFCRINEGATMPINKGFQRFSVLKNFPLWEFVY